MRVSLATTVAASLLLAACGSQSSSPEVAIEEARITLPAVKGRPGAGYFTAHATAEGEAIMAVTAPPPLRIEMHESMNMGGMASMRPIQTAPIESGKTLKFEPGGKHLMLFDIDPALKVGDKIPLTFRFTKAPAVTVEAELVGPGGAHAGH